MAARKQKQAANATGRHAALRFYDGAFVLDTATGLFYGLSPAADYLLRALEGGARPDQFPDLIMHEYGVDHATAVRDAELLLNQFSAMNLLDDRKSEATP